jgi:hypothetical protein
MRGLVLVLTGTDVIDDAVLASIEQDQLVLDITIIRQADSPRMVAR